MAQPVCAEQAAHPLREYGPLVVQAAAASVPENPVAQEPVTANPVSTFSCVSVTRYPAVSAGLVQTTLQVIEPVSKSPVEQDGCVPLRV